MKRLYSRGGAVLTVLAGCALLIACARDPKIESARLAERRSIELDLRIPELAGVSSNAVPRGEKVGQDAGSGALAGAGIWFSDPSAFAIAIVAPVVVLATGAAGGVLGGAYGAATGSSASPEQVDAALAAIRRDFHPEAYQPAAETALASAIGARIGTGGTTCVAPRSDPAPCRDAKPDARLGVAYRFALLPSTANGTSGSMDIVATVSVASDPVGLIQPPCAAWVYRAHAGGLLKLARNDGAALKARMAKVLPEMTKDVPFLLFPDRGSIAIPKNVARRTPLKPEDFTPGKIGTPDRSRRLGSWSRTTCFLPAARK